MAFRSFELVPVRAWLRDVAALGFDELALHHVAQDLDPFIDAFGDHVWPALR